MPGSSENAKLAPFFYKDSIRIRWFSVPDVNRAALNEHHVAARAGMSGFAVGSIAALSGAGHSRNDSGAQIDPSDGDFSYRKCRGSDPPRKSHLSDRSAHSRAPNCGVAGPPPPV
jgi:hypothetical protein